MRKVDHRTDVWAMAVIAFECLVGRRPFEEPTLGALLLAICSEPAPVPSQWGQVPAGFDEWFARGVAKDPDQRFGSAREAASALQALCVPGAAWRGSENPPSPGGMDAAVGALGTGIGPHAAQAITAPSYGGAAHALAPATGAPGVPVGDSTGTQMPPSAVTVPGVPSRSGAKLLLLGLAAVAVVGTAGGFLLLRGAGGDPGASAAKADSAEVESTNVEASAADQPRVEPASAASAAAATSPEGSSSNAESGPALPTRSDKRVAPATAKARPAAAAKPTETPPKASSPTSATKPSTRTARDRLDNGFGF